MTSADPFAEAYMPMRYPLIPMSLFKNGRYMAISGVAAVARCVIPSNLT